MTRLRNIVSPPKGLDFEIRMLAEETIKQDLDRENKAIARLQ